jgi:DNA-directed RNA polymerase specialized sigma24 family protein
MFKEKGLDPAKIHSPDPFLRAVARHALGRAKRRRTLIEQLAAGDDLDAISADLTALDADLAPLPGDRTSEGGAARATLEKLKDALAPHDALILALLFEDDGTMEEVAEDLAMPMEDVAAARDRILEAAAAHEVQDVAGAAPAEDRRGGS